jgi:Uri superfamily endonuclease
MQETGAYLLYFHVMRSLTLSAGTLEDIYLPAGHYAYVGSARRGIAGRIARHRRLAEKKNGKLHWHVDYLLVHPQIRLTGEKAFAGYNECDISRKIASRKGVMVPVSRFGSSDCRSGCKAHLYLLKT